MRIAIDLSGVRKNMTGPMIYSSGFLLALSQINNVDDFLVFTTPEVAESVRGKLTNNFYFHIIAHSNLIWLRVLWQQFAMPVYLKKFSADVLFAAFDLSPIWSQCPVVIGVRNPLPVRIKGGLNLKGRLHKFISYYSCRKASLVFYPTQYASKLLGDFMSVSIEKRRVVHHGTDTSLWMQKEDNIESVLSTYNIEPNRYLLFVSNFYPYKNPDFLIDSFFEWCQKRKRFDYKLVFVGGAPEIYRKYEQRLHDKVKELKMNNLVIFTGHIPRSHLSILYKQAAVFVLPTVLETFGLPFVEAMACGTPTICADTEFARELCSDAAIYINIEKTDSLVDAIDNVITQPLLADEMRKIGMKRAKKFSWNREAQETLNLIKLVGTQAISGKG
jgi:glycosyltransferase involved in cell wall biosynthesis